jgi:hypothetical protein
MKNLFILLSAAIAITVYAPAPSSAQGVGVDVPGVGVRIGDPDRPRYREDRRDEGEFREREVRRGQNCRTVTIQRDDGSVRRTRRCD